MKEDNFQSDFGLRSICKLIFIWNIMLMVFAYYKTQQFYSPNILLIILSLVFYFSTSYIVERGNIPLFCALGLILLSLMWFDYEFIGIMAEKSGDFHLKDEFLYSVEKFLFNAPLGKIWESKVLILHPFSILIMDFFILCYVSYFLLPFYHILVIYLEKKSEEYPIIGNYVMSFIILFIINFSFYMIVPVTGPQYYLKDIYDKALDFSMFGERIHNLIISLQPNFIDCFPSGHSAVSFLIIYWNIRLKFSQSVWAIFLSCMIVISTLLLRFHYLLDVIAALPLVYIAIFLSKKFNYVKNIQS